MRKCVIPILLFFFLSIHVFGQNHMIHGIIHTLDSIPLIGAEISVKSSDQVFTTDSLGRFAVACNPKDKLKVNAEGFYGVKVKVTDKIKFMALNLKMKSGFSQGNKSIGSSNVLNNLNTAAVASLSHNDIDFTRYTSVSDLIRDNFAGVQYGSGGGLQIRGSKTLMGDTTPLVVIDGAISDIGHLNSIAPINVGSIHILKDGTAAVYGSRGANGVILIETLKGGEF